jgi:hypothetical protein
LADASFTFSGDRGCFGRRSSRAILLYEAMNLVVSGLFDPESGARAGERYADDGA